MVQYGCETWTLRDAEYKRLEAVEMWVWMRMEKVSYKDRVTNEEVLKNVGENRCLLDNIRARKWNWVGHDLRGEGLMREVMEVEWRGKEQGAGHGRVCLMRFWQMNRMPKWRGERLIERVGGVGCHGPAIRQSTDVDDDDDDETILNGFHIT